MKTNQIILNKFKDKGIYNFLHKHRKKFHKFLHLKPISSASYLIHALRLIIIIMESQSDYARIDKSTHVHWSISSLASFLLYCSGAYLLKETQAPVFTKKLFGSAGYLVCMLIMGLFHLILLKSQSGVCPSCSPDSIYINRKGLVPGFTMGILGGVCLFLAELSFLWAWDSDPAGAGIIFFFLMGVVPICSFFSSIFFDEKFRVLQIVGILISMSGLALVILMEVEINFTGNIISYSFAISSTIFFSLRNLISKHLESNHVDVYTSGMLNCLGEILSGLILLTYISSLTSELTLLLLPQLPYLLLSSILLALGQYYFNQAVMTGNIGVVISLFNLNGFGFLFLDYWLNNYSPRIFTLLMCIVVLLGILIMIFGDKILDKQANKNRKTIIEVF